MLIKKAYTLVFIRTASQILLGLKKRGFGVNLYNGFGGKIEPNETIIDAALRELKEECCLTVRKTDLKNVGHLEFSFEGEPTLMVVSVFSSNSYEGTPKDTEEMSVKWFNYSDIPFQKMWPDDAIWLPLMLENKLFYGRFHYINNDTIGHYKVEELKSMEEFYAKRNSGSMN